MDTLIGATCPGCGAISGMCRCGVAEENRQLKAKVAELENELKDNWEHQERLGPQAYQDAIERAQKAEVRVAELGFQLSEVRAGLEGYHTQVSELERLQVDDLKKAMEFTAIAELAATRIEKVDSRVAELECESVDMETLVQETMMELAELKKSAEPRPMSEAPRDGSQVLILIKLGYQCKIHPLARTWIITSWASYIGGSPGWFRCTYKEDQMQGWFIFPTVSLEVG